MELEEIKSVWKEMSQDIERQKNLTNDLIIEMAHRKSSSRIKTIMYAESVGALVSVFAAIYLIINFGSFDYSGSTVAAVGLIMVLILSCVLGVRIVMQARDINISTLSYLQVLNNFNKLKATLRVYKRLSQVLYVLMPFLILPVFTDLVFDKNIFDDTSEFIETLVICIIVLPVVWWVVLKFYKSNLRQVSKAIKDYNKTENNN